MALWLTKTVVYGSILRPRRLSWHIPGLKPIGFVQGHFQLTREFIPVHWHYEYGPVVRIDGPLGGTQLSIDDKKALHHILVTDAYKFPKPHLMARIVGLVLGKGLVAAEGDDHKRQRRLMNPCFGPAHVKSMYPAFFDEALKLQNRIVQDALESAPGSFKTNMFKLASRAVLDVICSAGFGYDANALDGDGDPLVQSFNLIFGDVFTPRTLDLVTVLFPSLRRLISQYDAQIANMERAHETMTNVGQRVLRESQEAFRSDSLNSDGVKASKKDILSVLIRSNMAEDPKSGLRLDDNEVLAQCGTFLMGGVNTTASALSCAIYALCKDPRIQTKLREELVSVGTDSPSWDELNGLPYLDVIVRETLRLYTPIPGMFRVASKDSVVPLSKPYTDAKGQKHSTLFIPKNTDIYVPILHINTNTETWGPDAHEFKPERWLEGKNSLPEGVFEIPGVAFPTFLAGPRACIGFRFTLIEMKTMLFTVLRSVKMELAVPDDDVQRHVTTFLMRPMVKGQPEKGYQLPVTFSLL